MIDLSKTVSQLLKDAGLSQKEICNRTGIKPAALSHWVNNKRRINAQAYAAIYNECEREILRKGGSDA